MTAGRPAPSDPRPTPPRTICTSCPSSTTRSPPCAPAATAWWRMRASWLRQPGERFSSWPATPRSPPSRPTSRARPCACGTASRSRARPTARTPTSSATTSTPSALPPWRPAGPRAACPRRRRRRRRRRRLQIARGNPPRGGGEGAVLAGQTRGRHLPLSACVLARRATVRGRRMSMGGWRRGAVKRTAVRARLAPRPRVMRWRQDS